MADLPLVRRFPALAGLPRARFGTYPTPVERVDLSGGRTLLVKRDDLSGMAIGGNKVRGLEWLLGGDVEGRHVLTVGPRGSTHALATARCARLIGARTTVVRWDQEMNPAARRVDERLRSDARVVDARLLPAAYAIAWAMRARRRVRWISAGGVSALGMLGHVNAALELAEQIAGGECELPTRIFVPFGTGGTAAGLALGFRIADLPVQVVAVRVVPRIMGRASRVRRLAVAAARLIERHGGRPVATPAAGALAVDHGFYGGAYGRPIAAVGDESALRRGGIQLDDTYSRKAFAAAVASRDHRALLWLTFDGRLLHQD